jgi:hypothetical protein
VIARVLDAVSRDFRSTQEAFDVTAQVDDCTLRVDASLCHDDRAFLAGREVGERSPDSYSRPANALALGKMASTIA